MRSNPNNLSYSRGRPFATASFFEVKKKMKKLSLVNTKQGSASVHRFSNGNTLPLMQLPFGMVSFCPQTDEHLRWYYHPTHRCLQGIRITHQPSPWIGDHGAVCIMPQKGRPVSDPEDRWSGFRPEDAVLQPHYMKMRLLRYRCTLELTPTLRGAAVRLNFDDEQDNFLNAAVCIETNLSPHAILGACLGIEASMGRVRLHKNGPRTIDIDVLIYESYFSDSFELSLPHPRIKERAFVMVPMLDLFPSGRAPGLYFLPYLREIGTDGVVKTDLDILIP